MLTALVTGTSTGIGLETTFYFADRGYRVFAGARKPEPIENRPNILPVKLDVDQDESVRACVAEVLRRRAQSMCWKTMPEWVSRVRWRWFRSSASVGCLKRISSGRYG